MAKVISAQLIVQLEHYKMLREEQNWKDEIRHQLCVLLAEEIFNNRAAVITTYQSPFTASAPYGEQVIKAVISINLPEGNPNVYRSDLS